jgi:hypothetical protein
VAAAVALTVAAPLAAQAGSASPTGATALAADREAQLDPAMLDLMCSSRGSFQFAFGQHAVPGSSPAERRMGTGFALPPDAAPFVNAQPASTKWSDQFFAIEFTFDSYAVEEDAERLYETLEYLLAEGGWLQRPETFEAPLYKLAYAGELSWYKPLGSGDDPPELMLDLSELGDQITLSCARSDLASLAIEEELGHLPPGTRRPGLPELAIVPVPTVADCARPEVAAEIDRFIAEGSPDAYTRMLLARADYHDRLSQWMMWRLEQAGASRDEVFALALDAAMLDGAPEGFADSVDALWGLVPLIAGLYSAKEAGDRVAVCQAFVGVTDLYGRLAANGAAQTRALEASYRREAPKYGIDPEE